MSGTVSTTEQVFVVACTDDVEVSGGFPGGITLKIENVEVWLSSNAAQQVIEALTEKLAARSAS